MKINVALYLILMSVLAAGCRCSPPYRTSLHSLDVETCKNWYALGSWPDRDLDLELRRDRADIETFQKKIRADFNTSGADCWKTSREHHEHFDLYSIEFDDQGWLAELQGKANSSGPVETQLTSLFEDLEHMVHEDQLPLSVIIYTHGWHHSAAPDDTNVIAFRHLLEDASKIEAEICKLAKQGTIRYFGKECDGAGSKRRIVGIYVGWRGDSLIGPGINRLSIWDRKHAAETVALGSVQEFFARMHGFFLAHACHLMPEKSRPVPCVDVRMLSVGHSFGGLITYRALAPRLMLGVTETTYDLLEEGEQGFAYPFGDLTVLINPAFEATRFDPLAEAAACRQYVRSDQWPACRPQPRTKDSNKLWVPSRDRQLPVLIVATSSSDDATRQAFPAFRWATTRLERARGDEEVANVKAVGWDPRYQTHDLKFQTDTKKCERSDSLLKRLEPELEWVTDRYDERYEKFDADQLKLADCLDLTKATKGHWALNRPRFLPLWVIKADESVINGHNDFLNPHFVDFVRQIYFSILLDAHPERNAQPTASELPGSRDSNP